MGSDPSGEQLSDILFRIPLEVSRVAVTERFGVQKLKAIDAWASFLELVLSRPPTIGTTRCFAWRVGYLPQGSSRLWVVSAINKTDISPPKLILGVRCGASIAITIGGELMTGKSERCSVNARPLERQTECLSRQDKQLERRFREHAEAEQPKNAPSQELGGVFCQHDAGELFGALVRPFVVLLLACAWAGCSDSNDTATQPGYSTFPTSTGQATGSGGGSTTGEVTTVSTVTTGLAASSSGGIIVMNPPTGTTGNMFDDCEADISTAESIGLDMYVVFDRSGSMANRPPPNESDQDRIAVPEGAVLGDCPIDLVGAPAQDSKWCLASNALARFFAAPTTLDVRGALQFMTPANPDNYDICGPDPNNPHAVAAVPYTQLPIDAAHALITSLDAETPHILNINDVGQAEIGTRIEAALNGIAQFTAANADPLRKTIGVLITDGDPYNCEDDPAALAQIAADHYAATGILTFIIGMTGATAANLQAYALGGGGPEHGPDYCEAPDTLCNYWSVGDGNAQAFSEVLAAIQESVVIACEYAIPDPGASETLNPNLVAVTFNDASGAEPAPVARVADAASCDPVAGGWYYDNPDTPSSILLCPTSCSTVGAAPSGAQIEVLYGCIEAIL
jgi:hypothetical protein